MTDSYSEGWQKCYLSDSECFWKEDVDSFLYEHIGPLKGHSVLDVACGDGRNTLILDEYFDVVCALDATIAALQKLRSNAISKGVSLPLLLNDDLLEDRQFDLVVCLDGLPHMHDAKKAINRLCQFTAPGGKVIFNYFTKNDDAFGVGDSIGDNRFVYRDTLFTFLENEEVCGLIPSDMHIEIATTRNWFDPPHGEFRPFSHKHEASYFLLRKPL